MMECGICPRGCRVDRRTEQGSCGVRWNPVVDGAMVHMGEESVISGIMGSGTVFFSGCNLHCVYCQNYEISQEVVGKELTVPELANTFVQLAKRGVHNINLVSPSHFVPQITEAIRTAKERGIKLPFVYNSGGYDSLLSLKTLDGLVDIYMPDLKYANDVVGQRYSLVPDYFTVVTQALTEMYRQVGAMVIRDGIMVKGLLIRHLVLPGFSEDACSILDWIKANTPQAGVSLLAQFYPTYKAAEYPEIKRPITTKEYRTVVSHAEAIGLHVIR